MYVVCTAGHVDHGKSTLVRALTGMEPDRLAEERRRGLTIDIGFAWFDLERANGGTDTIAFVDLPGHHRFIANMLAGASSAEVALVVVSADEGPMPQTYEHLEILDLLGVRHGVVALTKIDNVDEATVAVATELTREALARTTLADAAIVPVSGVTGANLPALCDALRQIVAGLPAEADLGRPQLWVDRSFTIRGAGTVVTGTLRRGSLAIDDDVVIAPGQRPARIRGLQSLGKQVERAAPGGRVAINLAGLSRTEVRRGNAVVLAGQWHDVRVMEALVRALPGRTISSRGDWHLHCGSGEWSVQLRVIAGTAICDGEEGYVRIEAADPLPVVPGDRILLRESGRQRTEGGGIVLDVAPAPPPRGRVERAHRVNALRQRRDAIRSGDRVALVALSAASLGSVARRDVMALSGLGPAQASALADDRLLALGDVLVHADRAARWRSAAVDIVRLEHERHPTLRGVAKNLAVRAATDAGCPPAIAPLLVADAVRRQDLVLEGARLRLPTHRVQFDQRQNEAAQALMKLLDSNGFAPPEFAAAVAQAGAADVVAELEASGQVQRIAPNLAVTSAALARAHALLWSAFQREGPLTASRARDVLETTRKYVLPLLAALDERGCTRRQGDLRIVVDVEHHACLHSVAHSGAGEPTRDHAGSQPFAFDAQQW